MKISNLTLLFVLTCSFISYAYGNDHVHSGDIELTLQNSVIITPHRVFSGEMGIDTNFDGEIDLWTGTADSPGFDSDHLFPIPSGVGFNLLAPLKKWDGSLNDFTTLATTELTMRTSKGIDLLETATGFVAGAGQPVSTSGQWHHHYNWELIDQGQGVDPGIYLVELELWSSDQNIANSAPLWVVWNYGMNEQTHELAVDHVKANVPEPTSLLIVGLSAMLVYRRR